jgi:uncharacterized linocin/CFP29 family protein
VNNLKRELAPISNAAWDAIDDEARRVLKLRLAGRKLVDFNGPVGPQKGAVSTGRNEPLPSGPVAKVDAARRVVLPLIELRTYFELSRAELDAVENGADDPDLKPLIEAAARAAQAEDTAVFHGYAAGGIRGLDELRSPHPADRR